MIIWQDYSNLRTSQHLTYIHTAFQTIFLVSSTYLNINCPFSDYFHIASAINQRVSISLCYVGFIIFQSSTIQLFKVLHVHMIVLNFIYELKIIKIPFFSDITDMNNKNFKTFIYRNSTCLLNSNSECLCRYKTAIINNKQSNIQYQYPLHAIYLTYI